MRQATWTFGGHARVRAVAALVSLAVLGCLLMSHGAAAISTTASPAQTMPTMAMSSADADLDPVSGGAAVGGRPGAVTDCGEMGGSGAMHDCAAAMDALVLVALAVVVAVVVSGWVRRGSPVSGPTGSVVAAWGAPPWTVLSRAQLSVIRV